MDIKYLKLEDLEPIYNSCPEERETTIAYLGMEDTMKIYTSDSVTMTKLKKVFASNPDTVKCWEAGRCEGKVTGYFFEMPKKHLSLRQSFGGGMSEEKKAAFGEKIKKLYSEGKIKLGRR